MMEHPIRKKWPPTEIPDGGLTCRGCGCKHFYTVETRRQPRGRIMRRRECRNCGKRMTTYEMAKESADANGNRSPDLGQPEQV